MTNYNANMVTKDPTRTIIFLSTLSAIFAYSVNSLFFGYHSNDSVRSKKCSSLHLLYLTYSTKSMFPLTSPCSCIKTILSVLKLFADLNQFQFNNKN